MRMKPARTTRRGAYSSTARASAWSNASRVAKSRCGMVRAGIPAAVAYPRPAAPATLLITARTGMPASISAFRLLPRPEMSTTTDMVRQV